MTATGTPVQRSSESIAQLAAALAKAQGELVNPEKSLVATIKSEGAAEQTFRYAPLSSGLDIVRKTLGQQGIAVIQTTSTDPAAGVIMLTTMLAHASGEWIASDWPVCPIAETAVPHRMGAALTYARRYALFTLVGIAGEDDMDAPDMVVPSGETGPIGRGLANGNAGRNGSRDPAARHVLRRPGAMAPTRALSSLEGNASAGLRDSLIAEINALGSDRDASDWAQRRITDKDRLSATDARKVEEVFQQRLLRLSTHPAETSPRRNPSRRPARSRRPPGIDKSALTLPEPRRVRDRDHVRSVAQKPCLICGRRPSDSHHLRFVQSRAMGRKVSDEFTVPLCRGHHREVHRSGDEAAWWAKQDIEPAAAARALWLQSHPLPEIGASIAARTHPADAGKLTEQRNEADRDP
jgi:ERF superfamily